MKFFINFSSGAFLFAASNFAFAGEQPVVVSGPIKPGECVVACTAGGSTVGGGVSFPGGGVNIGGGQGGKLQCQLLCNKLPKVRPEKKQ